MGLLAAWACVSVAAFGSFWSLTKVDQMDLPAELGVRRLVVGAYFENLARIFWN